MGQQVLAYKCNTSGRLFVQKEQYNLHLSEVIKCRRKHIYTQKQRRKFKTDYDILYSKLKNVASLEMLVELLYENAKTLAYTAFVRSQLGGYLYGNRPCGILDVLNCPDLADEYEQSEIIKFNESINDYKFEDIQLRVSHSDTVSNSHNCPVGGVTNWGRLKPDLPTSYPGYQGHIVVRTSHPIASISDMLNLVNINTGTGGGSHTRCRYDVKIFDADFPIIHTLEAMLEE